MGFHGSVRAALLLLCFTGGSLGWHAQQHHRRREAFIRSRVPPPPPPCLSACNNEEEATTTTTAAAVARGVKRRDFLVAGGLATTATTVAGAVAPVVVGMPEAAFAEQGNAKLADGVTERPLSVAWTATDGFEDKTKGAGFINFEEGAYVAMKDDNRRTPKFQQAIKQRLRGTNGQAVVMDLGTGPFALLALMAARAGAGKVYAVESNPEAAKRARKAIAEARDVGPGVVEVIEGFSTDITLPQKADLVLAEIVGSVASEEGLCATILDAQRRHAKRPTDPRSFIPNRVQTWCAPASYALHYALGPPEFDWGKLGSEPVRLNCRDEQVQLLAEPLLLEDINLFGDGTDASSAVARNGATGFGSGVGSRPAPGMRAVAASAAAAAAAMPAAAAVDGDAPSPPSSPPPPPPSSPKLTPLVFGPVTAERLEGNAKAIRKELGRGGAPDNGATTELAEAMSRSLTGLALWPRLILDDDGTGNAIGDVNGVDDREAGRGLSGVGGVSQRLVVESRGPGGEHQKSHWQTVLAVMHDRPWEVRPGDQVRLDTAEVTLAGPVNKPAKYAITGAVVDGRGGSGGSGGAALV